MRNRMTKCFKGGGRDCWSPRVTARKSESMSDYMFMLDSHLSSDQSRVDERCSDRCESANTNIFFTGGSMRDMLGGFPIVEIDFTVEGNTVKLAQTIAKKSGGHAVWTDENRKIRIFGFCDRRSRHARHGAAGKVR